MSLCGCSYVVARFKFQKMNYSKILLFFCVALTTSLAAQRLDMQRGEDALKATRKIQSSLTDGENCIFTWSGNVYSRVVGERDQLLFRYVGMNIRASKTVVDSVRGYGYRQVSREILLYQDPETGELLKTWKNPKTGKTIEVLHVVNDPVNYRAPLFSREKDGSAYSFDGFFVDSTAFWSVEVPLFYPNPLAGDFQRYVGGDYHAVELFNFAVSENELLRTDKARADDVTIAWTRISPWLPWMEMGGLSGELYFNGQGKKIRRFDQLPEALRRFIETEHPDFKSAPPLNDTRPNETSWTYFKKWLQAKQK